MLKLVMLACNACSAMSFKSILVHLLISNSKIYVGIYSPKMAICPAGTVVLKDITNDLCCKFSLLLFFFSEEAKKTRTKGRRAGLLSFMVCQWDQIFLHLVPDRHIFI